ncbi:MAG: hypothetical protein EOM52_04510 [Clostridia bacterium]|nr:hypothetical protein [Clostridia bacterium]
MEEWNLCCEKPAGEGPCPPLTPALLEKPPLRLAIAFLCDVASAFEEDPTVYCGEEDGRVTALFRNSRCVCTDFLERYAPVMAALSRCWPVTIYGAVDGTEIGSLRTEGARWIMRSPSGKPFQSLGELCIQIKAEPGQILGDALKGMSYRRSSVALYRGRADGLLKAEDGAWFAYLDLAEGVSTAERLDALSLEQKEALWEVYLGEGISPVEFEWLWDDYESGSSDGMLEWELALQTALARLGIRVKNDAGGFQVTGESGRFRLDYITAPAAGKLFLKMLFPVSFVR